MSTTLVPFKVALLAALEAREALEGVSIEYAFNGDQTPADRIFLDNDVDSDTLLQSMRGEGPKPRDEEYVVGVTVETYRPGLTAQEAETRVTAWLAELDAVLASAPNFGVTNVLWAVLKAGSFVTGKHDRGYASRYEAAIQVKTRLRT